MTLLLLAGTGEARQIANALHQAGYTDVIASLAGATRHPKPLPVPIRIGGFGGADAQKEFIINKGISAVVDATHPFANQISLRTSALCQSLDLPYVQLLRDPWHPEPEDRWVPVKTGAAAKDNIPSGSTVFLAVGRQTLLEFEGLRKCTLICRQIDAPEGPFPFENGRFLVGQPPFSVEDELELFKKLKIDWLAVKNAGGAASKTKLTAAQKLGIPVLMLERPIQPGAPKLRTVEEALTWIEQQVPAK